MRVITKRTNSKGGRSSDRRFGISLLFQTEEKRKKTKVLDFGFEGMNFGSET